MPAWLRVQLIQELEAPALKAAPSVQGLDDGTRRRVWVRTRRPAAAASLSPPPHCRRRHCRRRHCHKPQARGSR
jgi:hypothetical protein